jgi:hypothetical protein
MDVDASKRAATSQPHGVGLAWKAPTTEELANIRMASELFQSNAFRLKAGPVAPIYPTVNLTLPFFLDRRAPSASSAQGFFKI